MVWIMPDDVTEIELNEQISVVNGISGLLV